MTGMVGKISRNITIVGSRTHVADAEVEIRTIKERLRCTEAGLPYRLCKRAIKWAAYGIVQAYNVVLRAGQEVAARELFTGVKTVYKRDFRAEFGEYVQAHVIPSGLDKAGPTQRAVGAVALCGTGNHKGTHWFLSLRTGKVFMADRWDPLPMPDLVIEVMNKLCDEDAGKNKKRASSSHKSNDNDILEQQDEQQYEQQGVEEGEDVVVPTARDDIEVIDEHPLGAPTHDMTDTAESLLQEQEYAYDNDQRAHTEITGEFTHTETGCDDTDSVNSEGESAMFSSSSDSAANEEENIDNIQRQGDIDSIQQQGDTDSMQQQGDISSIQKQGEVIQQTARKPARVATGDHFAEHAIHIFRTAVDRSCNKTTAKHIKNVLRLTVKKALLKDHDATVTSIIKEFKQLLDKGVWTVLRKKNLRICN